MKTLTTGAALLALTSTTALAAGLDRSGQSVAPLFAAGGTTSLSYGIVMPQISGEDTIGTGSYDNVGETYGQATIAHTFSVNDRTSFALIIDQPYGADIDYKSDPASTMLGGTSADFNSVAVTGSARYTFGERFSVFGGISAQRLDADVSLNGMAYAAGIVPGLFAQARPAVVEAVATGAGIPTAVLEGIVAGDPAAIAAVGGPANAAAIGAALTTALTGVADQLSADFYANGYQFSMEDTTEAHYHVGAAYEIPSIALRIAGTYHFETEHTATISESFAGVSAGSSEIEFVTPRSFNLEAQSGIAAGTLLTASWRWTEYSAVDIVPTVLGRDLVNLEDGNRYTLGVARQFSDRLAGSVSFSYEPEGDDMVSPLGPTNGLKGISIGGRWTDGPLNISGGLNYSVLGDATGDVGGVSVTEFTDNHVVGLGFKMEMTF